jgi:hypothetical protein
VLPVDLDFLCDQGDEMEVEAPVLLKFLDRARN